MIECLGFDPKGKWVENLENGGTYYMTPKEQQMEENGELLVLGHTFVRRGPKPEDNYNHHKYIMVHINQVNKINITFDEYDDFKMYQTIILKDGRKVLNITRNYDLVKAWKKQGIDVNEVC